MSKKITLILLVLIMTMLVSGIMVSAIGEMNVYNEPDCSEQGCSGVLVADDCSGVLMIRFTDWSCPDDEAGCLANIYLNFNSGSCTEDLCSGGTNIECGCHECVYIHSVCMSQCTCPF